jgi:arsenite methyltransferase
MSEVIAVSSAKDAALQSTSAGLRLGSESHLDRHYYALQKEYEETLRNIGLQPGWSVLDAGSGNGLFLPLMSQLLGPTGEIHALDLAPEHVDAIAKNRSYACPTVAKVGDITALPYHSDRFDAVWSANVSQYLTDEQLLQSIRDFGRVVKPGGLIAVKEVDISVWQFQPQDPQTVWRLLQALKADTQMSGAQRGTRMPLWFRAAGLTEIRCTTTLAERRHPLKEVERDYIHGNLQFLASLAKNLDLPIEDARQWVSIAEAPESLIAHPDFCYRELYVLTRGQKPRSARRSQKHEKSKTNQIHKFCASCGFLS